MPDSIIDPVILLAGNGDFPLQLAREINRNKLELHIIYLTSRPTFSEELNIKSISVAHNFTRIAECIRNTGSKIAFFAGNLADEGSHYGHLKLALHSLLDQMTRQYYYAAYRNRGGAVISAPTFLKAADDLFRDLGVAIRSPHDITTAFKPRAGFNSAITSPIMIDTFIQISQQALSTSANAANLSPTQAVIIDHDKVVAHETKGTRALLQHYADRVPSFKKFFPILVKLPTPDINPNIDLPFIGPDTIEQCSQAGIKGILIADNGILFEKRTVQNLSEKNRIFIYAATKDDLHTSGS